MQPLAISAECHPAQPCLIWAFARLPGALSPSPREDKGDGKDAKAALAISVSVTLQYLAYVYMGGDLLQPGTSLVKLGNKSVPAAPSL